MASPNNPPYTKRRSPPPPPPPKPITKGGFLGKSVLFALFLFALPLFPSQAPDFVAETVFTKFWELIHLLFVGIAVAYGLFSRRNVESGGGMSNSSRVDESSLSYVSRIFPVSSVFDEEFENEFGGNVNGSVKERKSDEIESREEEEVNEVRAWNSQYFQARSKVVVARPAYGLDGHVVHQPLGLPIRSLRSGLRDNIASEESVFSDNVNGNDESLVEESFDEVIAAPPAPVVQWEMMGMGENYPSNFQPLPVDETRKSTSSRSSGSSSSRTSFVAHSQDRFSPARSVSEESLNSNVEEPVQDTTLQSSSRSSSPPLPPSPPLTPSPPSPEMVTNDDTHRPILHSRHYSDGSVLEEDVRQGFEDELEENKVRGRRKEFYSKKEPGSKSLKLNAESSRRRNKSRRSYPPESVSSPTEDTTTRRRHLHQKSDDKLFENSLGKGLESDFNSHRIKKGRSQDSLELRAEDATKDKKFSESFPHLDVLFQPTNAKASRRAMRSSRGDRDTLPERIVTRHSEDDSMNKDLPGFNKELKSNSLGSEAQSWRASSKVPLRGKSVRTIRSDRHGKDRKKEEVSSDDRAEAKVETRGRTKSRRKQQEELAIVLHQEKTPEPPAKSEPEDDITEETETAVQSQVNLEEEQEEEEAAWESQSNASHDHNEVDRKAGEFIAKFREQIRLQKLTSGEQPRGGGGGGSTSNIRERHFR